MGGKRKLFVYYFVICLYETYCSSFDVSQLSLDEIDSMFGEDGCIEGLLVSMPHATELPQSYATLQSNEISQAINEEENKRKDPVLSQSGANESFTMNNTFSNNMSVNLLNSNGKSPMSLVNELALFNKVQHQYHLTNEEGPAHKKLFSVTLNLGDEEYYAEGASVKKAQHSAASKALQLTHYKHPPLKSSRNKRLDNCGFYADKYADSKSPISLVHEIAMKENLPVSFEIESEEGPPHMRMFVTKCTVGDKTTIGHGNGKKLSKKIAAERMLEELKSLIPSSSMNLGSCTKRRKRKASKGKNRFRNLFKSIQAMFRSSGAMTSKGSYAHQFEPEIHKNDAIGNKRNTPTKVADVNSFQTIPKKLFKGGRSHAADSLTNIKNSVPLSQSEKPKDHLKYLAKLRDFQVHFTDFKKGNHSEILTLVSLTTDPPQVCLGSGSTTDASHNRAALTALKVLSKIGLDSMRPVGLNIKKETEAQRDRGIAETLNLKHNLQILDPAMHTNLDSSHQAQQCPGIDRWSAGFISTCS